MSSGVRIIKKYRRGQLFCTILNRCVAYWEVAQMVADGYDVLVICGKTKRDVTQEILESADLMLKVAK